MDGWFVCKGCRGMAIMKKMHVLDAVKIIFRVDLAAAGLLFALRLLQALVPSLQTLIVADFIDQVILSANRNAWDGSLMLLISLLVALIAYRWISKSLTELLEQHMEMRLRAGFKPRLLEKISRLKYEYMENEKIRDKISRVALNAEGRVREAYGVLLLLLELGLKVAGILAILFLQIWWLAFVLLAVSIPCFYTAMKSGKENYEVQADVTKVKRLNEYYNEMLKRREYAEERTLFGYGQEYEERFLSQYEKARRYTTRARMKWFVRMKAGSMAVIAISAIFLAVTMPLVLNGRLRLGMFMALTGAVFGIVQNMSWDLTYSFDRAAWYNEYFQELEEIFGLEEERGGMEGERGIEGGKKIGTFQSLEFREVSFRYPGTERYILKNLSFRIEAGKKYAFVGANGAGKTTMIKLLNGLYQGYEGKILVNGEDIRRFDRDFLSNVFQDFARYPVSIRENMVMGRKERVSDAELEEIIEKVGLGSTIAKQREGVDTVLGKVKEDSQDLSGGEWQKIALARCALSKAPVRILDEPTSAMDPIYENELYLRFQQLSQGKTVLLISHRLASVKAADFIYVIEDGTVVQAGSHSGLMEEGGLYKQMYTKQAKWYEEKGDGAVYEA